VRSLPVLIKTAASTSATTANHPYNMAIRMLGTGYDWTFQESSRRIHSCTIDKFTKWIEFKLIASLTSAKAVEFIQDIIFRFGIPNNIITDLGSNFTSSEFFDFCEQKSIQIKYASVAHPRANGQVERANRMILEALRKKIFDKTEKFVGKLIRELPYVVWSLRTQPSRALNGNTPFFMVYGSEAVLPADLKFGAPRLIFENIAEAEATRLEDVDILEEERLNMVI
jgi:transposase InsO family protein